MKTTGINKIIGFTITVLLVLMTSACGNSNDKNENTVPGPQENSTILHIEDPGQPTTDINVSRRYDANGNLVQFDSTYNSYFKGITLDSAMMDSLVIPFYTLYNEKHAALYKSRFDRLFFGDSMLYVDFFHADFFRTRYALNIGYYNQMMYEMDSLKNDFYKNTKLILEKDRNEKIKNTHPH